MNSPPTLPPKSSRPGGIFRRSLRLMERGLAIFGALVLLGWGTIDVSFMVSNSMSPTLQGTGPEDGDRVVTEMVTYKLRSPRRWEVMTFRNSTGDKLMKRVAGLPGETVQLADNGELMINGKVIGLPPTLDHHYLRYGNLVDNQAVNCGEGYFVLGDDLRDSLDSRFEGVVPPSRIIGRSWLVIAPWERAGLVR